MYRAEREETECSSEAEPSERDLSWGQPVGSHAQTWSPSTTESLHAKREEGRPKSGTNVRSQTQSRAGSHTLTVAVITAGKKLALVHRQAVNISVVVVE